MRIGIDASNIRGGGGLTHLARLLAAGQPREVGISQVIVWAARTILDQLPSHPWLTKMHERLLDRSLPMRLYWQQACLARVAERYCDVLFVPGGLYTGRFRPFVAMSQIMLPFASYKLRRYGLS